jgi:hypothetical protein
MPDGYSEYFESIYIKAKAPTFPLDTCSLRVISGDGFGNFGGGNTSISGNTIRYPSLGETASCLTILDISNAVYAVAHFEKKIPAKGNWRKFRKAAVFEGEPTVPVVCDKNDATWAFRVGYDGQHAKPLSEADNSRMSKPIGDSIAASLLYAVKSFIETDKKGDLDALFCQTYGSISTTLPSEGAETPLKPHSSLSISRKIFCM